MRRGRLGQNDVVSQGRPLEGLHIGRLKLIVQIAGDDIRVRLLSVDGGGVDPPPPQDISDPTDHAGRLLAATDSLAEFTGLLRFEQVVEVGEQRAKGQTHGGFSEVGLQERQPLPR